MNTNLTLTMIKPDAVCKGLIGEILKIIQENEFKIKALKLTQLSQTDAKEFYLIHQDKPFFNDLIEFMTSGPIVAAVLEKENAVNEFRKLIGNTNPEKAEEGTIRKLFADSMDRNAIHGADSDENASIEISFHFSKREIF
jgi:nucleoside-diphosphate kinase